MIYYTTVKKQHICPMWNISLTITAKYRFFDSENPYIAKYASCGPIITNLKLPPDKRNKEYSLYLFCKCKNECLSNIQFKPQIDITKDGYSQ